MFAALALLIAAPADAERLPPPRVAHFDRDGRRLPDGAVLRLGTLERRHHATAVFWSDDGKLLWTHGSDEVREWDAATGKLLAERPLESTGSNFAAATPDGRIVARLERKDLVVRREDGGVIFRRRFISKSDRSIDADLSPDGQLLAILTWPPGETDRKFRVTLVRLADGKALLDNHPWPGDKGAPSFNRDGTRLMAHGGGTHCLDATTGKTVWSQKWEGPFGPVTADGKRVLVFDSDEGRGRRVRLCDASTGDAIRVLADDQPAEGFSEAGGTAALSPDGSLWAYTRRPNEWEVVVAETAAGGKVLWRLPTRADALAFSPDGAKVATVDDALDVWDVKTGKRIWSDPAEAGHLGRLTDLAWSRDGRFVATASERDGSVALWAGDVRRWGVRLAPWEPQAVAVRADEVVAAVRMRVGDDWRWELRTFDLTTGNANRQAKLDLGKAVATQSRFESSGDRLLLSGDLGKARWVGQVEVATGQTVASYSAALRVGGKRRSDPLSRSTVAVREDMKTVRLADGRLGPRLDGPKIGRDFTGGVQSRDGALLVMTYAVKRFEDMPPMLGEFRDFLLVVWEVAGGRVAWSRHQTSEPYAVDFLPDGRRIVIRDGNGKGTAIDLATDAIDARPACDPGRPDIASGICVHPTDRRTVAMLCYDTSVLMWDVPPPHKLAGDLDADAAWNDLASDDAGKAWRAVWKLADAGRADVFRRAKRAETVEGKAVEEWIAKLDAKEFRVREAATKELKSLGDRVEPALKAARAKATGGEVTKRLDELLAEVAPDKVPPTEVLRSLRCVAGLERIGTAEAEKALTWYAEGAAGARVTEAAQDALDRLGAK